MLLIVEKVVRGGIYHSIYRYSKANNKYMKDFDKNKESSYLQYWVVNNLYGWAMLQKLPITNFDEGYFLEVDVQYLEKIHELHNDLPLLPERMRIEKNRKACS